MNKFNYKIFSYIFVIFSLSHVNKISSNEIIDSLTVPNGFKIEIFVNEIDSPRQIAESDVGYIFVGSRTAGTISAIDKNKDIRVIAEGLSTQPE